MREEEIKDKLEELKLNSEKKAEMLADILKYNKSKSAENLEEGGEEYIKRNEISPSSKKSSVKKVATFIFSAAAMLALIVGIVTLGQNNINKKSTGGQGIKGEQEINSSDENNETSLTTPSADDYYAQELYLHGEMGVAFTYNKINFVIPEDSDIENNMLIKLRTENDMGIEVNGKSFPVLLNISSSEQSKDDIRFRLMAQSEYDLQEEDVLIGINSIPAKKLIYMENENGTGQRIIYYVFENKDSSKSNKVYLMEIYDYCNDINTSVYDKYWKEIISSICFSDYSEEKTTLEDQEDYANKVFPENFVKNIVKVVYSKETDAFLFFLGEDMSEAETLPIEYDGVDIVVTVDAKRVYDSNRKPITDIDYIISINKDSNLKAEVGFDGMIMETFPAQATAGRIIILDKSE